MINLTDEQQAAVNATANNLVISASAGSGKTYTMISRIEQIIKLQKTTLDQILVLTFTDESARDMRKKLKARLGEQITPAALQAASIGTFHSFCANLVRAWFTVAGVSPSFGIMDAVESNKVRFETVAKIAEEFYEQAPAAVDLFAATRSLDGLYAVILKIADFLETRAAPESWLQNVALQCYQPTVDTNVAVQELVLFYHDQTRWFRQKFIDLQYASPQMDFVMSVIDRILQAQDYTAMHALVGLEFPRLKPDKNFVLYEDFKMLRTKFYHDVVQNITAQFSWPISEIKSDILHDRVIVEQLLFLVEKFNEAYAAKKTELKKLDFADLEQAALRVLANAEAMASIRGQYKYIFVDEGQDTNPVQFKIIDILRGDDKFFYMVGDVKQSIYGFRGCEPQMFADLTLTDLVEVLRFNHNFRSNNAILNYVNQVFTTLMADYAEKHQFILSGPVPTGEDAVQIELAEDLPAQMELVYRQIVNAHSRRHQAYGDIAILSETGGHFPELRQYLQARGIPCVIDRATDALREPEIVVLNNFLFAALNPTNELARYLTLQNLFGCTNDDLALIKLGQKTVPEIDAVLTRYQELSRTLSTEKVLTMAAVEFDLIERPVVDAYLNAIRGVNAFDTVARYLYLIEHDLVKIEINVGGNTPDAVKIMTIHHAKGLEFPFVILFNGSALWTQQGGRQDKKPPLIMDKDLGVCVLSADPLTYVKKSPVLRLGIEKKQAKIRLQEKIRLLYVALTRAKENLYLVGAWKPTAYRPIPNCLFDLLNPTAAPQCTEITLTPEKNDIKTVEKPQYIVLLANQPRDTLVKQSVTALAKTEEVVADYVAPAHYDAQVGGKEYGTAYHRQIQYGDLPEAVAALVDGYTLYKELPFLYQQNATIVQGIMDLLAVRGNEAIIVDYKTTRSSEAALVQRYREQLRLYAQALPHYQVKTYLYSTVHKKIIAVS